VKLANVKNGPECLKNCHSKRYDFALIDLINSTESRYFYLFSSRVFVRLGLESMPVANTLIAKISKLRTKNFYNIGSWGDVL
jgi:hypothetical protein